MNYFIVDERTPSLRGYVLGADTTGPAVARVVIQGRMLLKTWYSYIFYVERSIYR